MTTVREIVDLPGMPTWIRLSLGLVGIAILRFAHVLAAPMLEAGWSWSHGLPALVAVALGADALHAAVRKRWPLVLFLDLFLGRIASGRWS